MEIKVGYLIAYDYAYLQQSLPTVYDYADKITIALDKERKTYAGESFTVEPAFFSWLNEIDKEQKISMYEDNFYVPGMHTRDAEVRERNMLAKAMGDGGWHIQIDTDEYFVDFASFIEELRELETRYKNRKVSIRLYWHTIFKIVPEGYFLIDNTFEAFALATNHPVYEQGRYNHSIENVTLNHIVLHQSWGRGEDELAKKLRNWSHSEDFDTASYFDFWKSVGVSNYKYIYNFHPLFPDYWKQLKFVQASSITDVIKFVPSSIPVVKTPPYQKMKRWIPPAIFDRLVKN